MLIQMFVVFGPPHEDRVAVLADEDLLVVVGFQVEGYGFHIVGSGGCAGRLAQRAEVVVVGFEEELWKMELGVI